ncbi:sodium-dependent transporter [Paenibacillus sp. PCH8]|uniref:sodium-dependent transporter n=1 Tax=Paenibacillus sp. PCH8 TaxID=2066524 RepID=UPI000CF84AF5|nr:sodium-dependent transporter [Paenibacillus sp. PCH8]PQP84267.1 sodium-dependent transporter [Paenibacillus sp. PCH8]
MNFSKSDLNQDNSGKGERFSQAGFILAAIGSSVGLGNMWKFPYITGENGGAAFFLLFIVCLVLIGLPVLLAELAIGRSGRGSAATAFVKAGGHKGWLAAGLLQVLTPFIILSFYVIIAGWTLQYSITSFSGSLYNNADFAGQFDTFIGGYMPIVWQLAAVLITGWIVAKGVSNGIEKFNKVLIPAMLVLLVILMIRAVTLPGAGAGVSFFLNPDFSQLTAESALVALGHAFFSLSLGMGILVTYGSYVDKNQSLGAATVAVGAGDLIYAFIAGLIIFPTTFSFGIAPDQGPSLIFVALPAAFSAMPLGFLFGGLFFVLLAIAALTSAVSLLEVPVKYFMERLSWSRSRAVWTISIAVFIVGLPSALSMGLVPEFNINGTNLFDWMDFAASNIMLPVGGLLVTIFAGYFWKTAAEASGLRSGWFRVWLFMLRYVAPVLVLLVLLHTSGIIHF